MSGLKRKFNDFIYDGKMDNKPTKKRRLNDFILNEWNDINNDDTIMMIDSENKTNNPSNSHAKMISHKCYFYEEWLCTGVKLLMK